MNIKIFIVLCVSSGVLWGCSKETAAQNNIVSSATKETVTTNKESPMPPKEMLAPEDNPNLKGTPVLGFKLRDSTFESVKKRLSHYQVGGESYAGGGILANDGSGFDIDGLMGTQFGFDQDQKLAYASMVIKEVDHMNHTTYKKVVNYVQENDYKVIDKQDPFVGNRSTTFKTPNQEFVVVSAPHMGGFKVEVEYFTDDFEQKRRDYQSQQRAAQAKSESANF
ncbi:hypothetical protein [Acinetobacter sp. NIPH 298]|uniref:hypothetical protein n=1 Tax=Acinetobacter sp. NIPH 298 TaxID=1217692 RepID=UPI0002CE1601|nr:hypothetical protein [Acinetobacter sp. NIPH 298]ENW97105.1 hypothetical protein F903_00928 [Acinetobacter sp. NIPH 298]